MVLAALRRLVFLALLAVATSSRVAAAESPTFNHDVAPILHRNCVTCHHPGSNGAFSLVTFEDVRPRARQIALATTSRYMPPWKPEPNFGDPFLDSRRLTDDQIDTIQRWVDGGAPRGDPADLLPAPDWSDGWRLGRPDLVIRMPEPFEVQASGPDVFRIFVFPIPTSVARYVKAMDFLPGTRAVHHANLRLDETRTSRQLDEKDPAPGYDGLLARTAHYPDGYFFGWTPGQLPPASADLAWPLNPGTDIVLQLHLRPTGQRERVQAAIGLYFTDRAPRLTPAMVRLGKQDLDIPPGDNNYVVTDSYVLPVDVDVYAVQPHAHYRAKEVTGVATLPDGTTKGLIAIRDWDFDWQDQYRYATPFALPKGTTLSMRYVFDNSTANRRNPQVPPQRVHWGQHSTDEMSDLWIQVVARSPADRDRLTRDIRRKVFREDILGYESVLRITPDDVTLHDDVALLYLALGAIEPAIRHFSESVRLAPSAPASHFNLGTALSAAGRVDEAIAHYEQALAFRPDYAAAHTNLGSVLLTRGRLDEAAVHLHRAIDIEPTNVEAHNNLGKLLAYGGRFDEAVAHLNKALEIRENFAEGHYNLAHALVGAGRAQEALPHYRAALDLRTDWPPVLAEFAWLLATHTDQTVRDPAQAVRFATHAVSLTNRSDPQSLDALAAAYAAEGRFDQAVATVRAALDLMRARSSAPAVDELERRLARFLRHQPYIDVKGTGPTPGP